MRTIHLAVDNRARDEGLDFLFEVLLLSAFPDRPELTGTSVESAEHQDITAAIHGDDEAFRRIVQRHQSTIATQMQRFSRDPMVVEELVHDVFVEAFMSLNTFRHRSPFEHWLRKIAVRVGYRLWKTLARDRQRRDAMLSEPNLREAFETPCQNESDAGDRLHRVLGMLSQRDRLVLTLLYWDGCTVAEAAELAGWTQTLVKVQAHRARKRLKRLLQVLEIQESDREA